MRSLLRQSFFAVHQLLRDLDYPRTIGLAEQQRVRRALALCRRATARDPHPAWLAGASKALPPSQADAVAVLKLIRLTLMAVDLAWKQRLIAAGINPKWPETA